MSPTGEAVEKEPSGRTVLVTGATGFVGSHVVDALQTAAFTVRALVRDSSDTTTLEAGSAEVLRGALDDQHTLTLAMDGADAVVHLAALTHARSKAEYVRVNAHATRQLVFAAMNAVPPPRRFVYVSSLAAVGPARDGRPVRPDDPPYPLTTYGRTKLAGENACRDAGEHIETVILRAPGVYGPRDREILRFFRFAETGWVPLPAGGPRPVQLIHATDLARAVVLAVTVDNAQGTFHVAEPQAYPMRRVAYLVGDAIGKRVRILPVPGLLVHALGAGSELLGLFRGRSSMLNRDKVRELMAPGWLCETDTARAGLGFEAGIALPEGLRSTAEWYRRRGWLKR